MSEEKVLHETAFLIIRRQDGTFYATADLGEAITLERVANRQDMKHGCRDISDIISYSDASNLNTEALLSVLKPEAPETVAGSIREALDERGIL